VEDSLARRIEQFSDVECRTAVNYLVSEATALTPRDQPLPSEEEALQVLQEHFPDVTPALLEAKESGDEGEYARQLLLELIDTEDSQLRESIGTVTQAVKERDEGLGALAVPHVLLAAGVVMLLSLKVDFHYEEVNGKRKWTLDVDLRPAGQRLIEKVLKLIPGF
jgi:hypothetical protein